jgi:Domain of unknown function (DUF1929)/Kelch motif
MMRRSVLACCAGALSGLAWIAASHTPPVSAQGPGPFPDPNSCNPAECGKTSPLIPMQSTEAVHMGLVWKRDSNTPKLLYHARFPEYIPNDVADPAMVDAVLATPRTAGVSLMDNGVIDFNRSLRDVLHPSFRDGMNPTADSFQRLTYGGYLLRQGLSQSVPTRIVANRTMERQLLFDISHPDAFKTNGKFHTAVLDEADFALNRAAFSENGYSKGMFYNTYCNARVTLSDGRVYVFGGHDMQSNNGLFKVNVFDPETEEWVRRSESCTTKSWQADPFGLNFFAANPGKVSDINAFYDGCDPRVQANTQAPDPSDQKYARWYPSAAPLPNDWVLVLGGFDQDNTVPPDPTRATRTTPQQDAAFTASRVNIVVPEVYDPVSDRNIALENARMAFPLYPQMEVVGTGPGKDDWMVCTMNGEETFGVEAIPGGAKFFGPWRGKTWCLDVLAAMKDPKRSVPAQNHWRALDEADEVRPYCCPTASLIELNEDGQTVSHKWFMISGQKAGEQTGTVEVIEFTDAAPQWKIVGSIQQPLSTTKAVLLPDGKVLIGHGVNRGNCTIPENGGTRPCTFSEKEGHFFQMFDPATGQVTQLARTTVSRGLHGTATLLPDASVFFAGENREALVRNDDPAYPLQASWAPDGMLVRGDPDQGVPVGQVFYPPYLFTGTGGQQAARPRILDSPKDLSYRGSFDVKIAGSANQVASVVLLRSDHNTHSLTAGDRYVKLAFHVKGNPNAGEVRVVSPKLPAQAVPGIYMLFVVNQNGVPSTGMQIRLQPETRGSSVDFR